MTQVLARAVCRTFAVLLFSFPVFTHAQNQPVDVKKIADSVDDHYNSLRSMQAEFEEFYSGAGMRRSESGTLWLKKPGRMRWEYRQPREKLFVTDGKIAWFYIPGEKQARRAPIKKLDDLRSPLRFMLGKTKLVKEFDGLSLAPDVEPQAGGEYVFRGIPKGMEDRVSQVLLEITPERSISRIVIEELDGSTTEFRFRNQRENVEVAEGQFRFKPPAGVEVMAATELSP
jgi:outer membrane lipoprotein carrier protein